MDIFNTKDEVDRETFLRDAVHLERCCETTVVENDGFGTYRDENGDPWNDNGDGTWSKSLF